MALIVIENLAKKTIQVLDFSKTVLGHLQANRIDWMHACGGKGRCTTCMFRILRGSENLEPKTGPELKYQLQGALQENERLACQAKIRGDIVISVPQENKLPHLAYSD
jgi:2Fe-2S ferredoxin